MKRHKILKLHVFILFFCSSSIHALSVLGSIQLPSSTGVTASGNYVYVASSAGLLVIDISVPLSPQLVSTTLAPGQFFGIDVGFVDGFVFMSASDGNVYIFNVYDPLHPLATGAQIGPGHFSVGPICLFEGYAYVGSVDAGGGLVIADISKSAAQPMEVGYLQPIAPSFTAGVNGLSTRGNYTYVAVGNNGFGVIEISNFTALNLVGECSTSNALDVVLSGTHAYVSEGVDGLAVIDISNPLSPMIVGSGLPMPARAVALSPIDSSVVAVAGASGFQLVNVSNPLLPVPIGNSLFTNALDVEIVGSAAFILGDLNSTSSILYIVDMSSITPSPSSTTAGAGYTSSTEFPSTQQITPSMSPSPTLTSGGLSSAQIAAIAISIAASGVGLSLSIWKCIHKKPYLGFYRWLRSQRSETAVPMLDVNESPS